MSAESGSEGIQLFERAQQGNAPFEVVLTDLGMPHMDGRKVARSVKAISPTTPVVLLTGWGLRSSSGDSLSAHIDHMLCKPPQLVDLREVLRRVQQKERRRNDS